MPDEHRWQRRQGVTLIGDAAHLMAPSGEGANLAMLDAAELAESIAKMNGDLNSVIKDYEETMFLEAKKKLENHMNYWIYV